MFPNTDHETFLVFDLFEDPTGYDVCSEVVSIPSIPIMGRSDWSGVMITDNGYIILGEICPDPVGYYASRYPGTGRPIIAPFFADGYLLGRWIFCLLPHM